MISPDLLRRYPFFGSLADAHQQAIAMLAEEVNYSKGEAIFHEGRPADTLYLLLEGDVELYHNVKEERMPDGRSAEVMYQWLEDEGGIPAWEEEALSDKEFLVGSINPGEIVAISALIEPHRLTATARTAAPSRLIQIDATALLKLCAEDPWLSAGLMRATAKTAMERLHFTRVQLTAVSVL